MNEWMMHLYSALLCIAVHPKRFTIMGGGGLSSTTTSVQHPSAMGFLMATESQELGLTYHPKTVLVDSIVYNFPLLSIISLVYLQQIWLV